MMLSAAARAALERDRPELGEGVTLDVGDVGDVADEVDAGAAGEGQVGWTSTRPPRP